MLEVFVIRPDASSRADVLLHALASEPRIRVTEIPAVMLRTAEDVEVRREAIAEARARLQHGRALIPQEFGCALSHNEVRRRIAMAGRGAVVLEDDARITEPGALVEVVEEFLRDNSMRAALLNLHQDQTWDDGSLSRRHYRRRLAPTPLAVAYALTPEAAHRLLEASEPVSHTADWPPARMRFYAVSQPLVRHGDDATESLIDQQRTMARVDASNLGRDVLTLRHFRRHGRDFGGFRPWFAAMFEPRLRHHADRMLCSVRRLGLEGVKVVQRIARGHS